MIRAAGINCDAETAHAFECAGASATCLHANRIVDDPNVLKDFQLLAIPGGFSYGDDIAAGRILGDRLTRQLGDVLRRFVDAGKPVIGICNGFQVLTQTDLLPGKLGGRHERICALTQNADEATGGRYACRWVSLRKIATHSAWTADFADDETIEMPMAHAEGRLVFRDDDARHALAENGRIAIKYVEPASPLPADMPYNPNGSMDDIAGLCDESGLVLGLMPHPERYVDALQHPAWGRRKADGSNISEPAGLRLFRSAVAYVSGVRV